MQAIGSIIYVFEEVTPRVSLNQLTAFLRDNSLFMREIIGIDMEGCHACGLTSKGVLQLGPLEARTVTGRVMIRRGVRVPTALRTIGDFGLRGTTPAKREMLKQMTESLLS
jgi:hypothetical protein